MAAPTSNNEVTARRLSRLLVGADGNGGLWGKLNTKFDNRLDRYDAVYTRSNIEGDGWVKLAESPSIVNPKQRDFPFVWDVVISKCQAETTTEQLCLNVRYETSGLPGVSFRRYYTVDRTSSHKFAVRTFGAGGTGTGKFELWAYLHKFWGSIAIREIAGSNGDTNLNNSDPRVFATYYSYYQEGGSAKPVSDLANNIQVIDSTNFKFAMSSDVSSAITALDVASVGGAGKYISAISETDGKISATATSMDTAPTASSTNAVTSGGIKTVLDGKAPTSHASSATTYGVGTTANYGHVKLATGDMNGATHADGVAVSKNHTHSQYLSREGGGMTGATNGYFLSTRDSMVGNEYNCLLNAQERGVLSFTQSGTGQLSNTQVWSLFDGKIVPQYSTTAIDPADPYILTLDASKAISGIHMQAFAAFGWTCRYWWPIKFKVEAYNVWESKNEWVTIADYSNTNYAGQYSAGVANLFIPLGSSRANPHTGQTQMGAFNKIRITIYQADSTDNRWGISEIFYCYPEAYTVYGGLHAYASSMVNTSIGAGYSSSLVNATVGNSDYARVKAGSTGDNAGYLELATGDDGTEPIYVRQYTGTTVTNNITLLDDLGNTAFPNQLSAPIFRSGDGVRKLFIQGASIQADVSSDSGGWACSLPKVKTSTTEYNILGVYGQAGTMSYLWMGGTYNSPNFKMTPAGAATFTSTVTAAGFTGPLTGNATTATTASTAQAYDTSFTGTNSIKSALDGKASTSHTHSEIYTPGDQRDTATAPTNYNNKLKFAGMKRNSVIGNPSSDTYSYIVGLRGWNNYTGGLAHELAFNNTGIFSRTQTGSDEATWGSWSKLYTSSNLTSQSPSSGGTTVSLCTNGEKATWNAKQDALTVMTDTEVSDLLAAMA